MSSDPHDVEQDNMDNAGGPDGQAGYYQGTDYSLPYISPWSRIVDDPITSKILRHMNCSYMGTPGHPPTLLALKQHAQSLAVLISYLEPSISSGRVDGFGRGDHDPVGQEVADDGRGGWRNVNTYIDNPQRRLDSGGAFDWLASLDVPYQNDDPNHHRPLNALMNEVHSRSDMNGTMDWCPLTKVIPRKPQDATRTQFATDYTDAVATNSFASHANLVKHANECLELLDHEFSATGGILSLVPPDGAGFEPEEFQAVRNTLLGQMLMHMQAMYLRMHQFEMDVGNMRDALAKEAVVPMQSLTANGPDASSGREIVVSQDRYIIVNANDETWKQIHAMFDRQEALLPEKERIYRDAGISGERQWYKERGGAEYARGIIPIDVTTRLYRLKGNGHSTIFISPAYAGVSSTEGTRRNERGTGLLSMVQPRWPERVSEWERRYKEQIAAASKAQRDAFDAQREGHNLAEQNDHLRHELAARDHARAAAVTAMEAVLTAQGDEAQQAAFQQQVTNLTTLVGRAQNERNVVEARYEEDLRDLQAQLTRARREHSEAQRNESEHYRHIEEALGRAVAAMDEAGIANPDVTASLTDAIYRAHQQMQHNAVDPLPAGQFGSSS